MEPAHIYYKELVADKENIFIVNIAEQNEVDNVKFSKAQEYGMTRMTIISDIKDSSILKVTNERKLKALSKKIQELVKNKKEPNLDLTISNSETKDLITPFKKRSETDCSPTKLTFYSTTTRKNQEIAFYNYNEHLKKVGFE